MSAVASRVFLHSRIYLFPSRVAQSRYSAKMPGTIHINDETHFAQELRDAGQKLVVVDFYATWCGPCKMISPAVEDMALKYRATTVFLKVDVDENSEIAGMYGVRAMPTFMFFKNSQKIEEFSGASAQKLEDCVKRLSGASAAPVGPVVGHDDVKDFIQTAQVECLNESPTHTKAAIFTDDGSYLESDCDEQLLLTIPFSQNLKIHSLRIKGPDDGSAPKDIKLFINRPNVGFDEAEAEAGVQELSLTAKEVADGSLINLKFVRFQNVATLTIFVHSNQGDNDTSKINFIELIGSPVATTNMKEFKRVAGKEGESDH